MGTGESNISRTKERYKIRVRFFIKKIQDWDLKSERIRKWILRFFTSKGKNDNPFSDSFGFKNPILDC